MRWPGFNAAAIAAVVGILAHGVWLGCVMFSLQYGVPAGVVALVVALQPMTTGIFSGIIVGERTPFFRWAGLFTGFAGVVIAVTARTDFQDADSIFAGLIPFGSVVAITASSLILRKLEVQKHTYLLPVDLSLFYQSLGTALAVSVPAMMVEGLATQWEPVFIWSMLWLIIVVSLGAYGLMWILIGRMDATRVASLFYLGPPVTMLMAWAAFGDTLLVTDIVGLAVVAAGIMMTMARIGGSSPGNVK